MQKVFISLMAICLSFSFYSQSGCSSDVFSAVIDAYPNPAPLDDPIVEFKAYPLGSTYVWRFEDGTTATAQTFSHRFLQTEGEYNVTLIASNGVCLDSTQVKIVVNAGLVFYIPNAFTPDGDENNNVFEPVFTSGYDHFSYHLTMYDRWGEAIFESRDDTIGWDGTYGGTIAKEGTYIWTIQFRDLNTDQTYTYTGNVLMLK